MTTTNEQTPILMTEDYWANSPLSIVRRTGRIIFRGVEYIIVNKEGKDIFQCSLEADRTGRQYAIEPGEPCDLVDVRYTPIYRKVGRDTFIGWVKDGLDLKKMKLKMRPARVPRTDK